MTSKSTLDRYGRLLQSCTIVEAMWGAFLAEFVDGDLFVDPPYLGKNGHRAYTKEGWGEDDATALATHLATKERGRFVLTEQEPGGASLYQDILKRHRFVQRHQRKLKRNCDGANISRVRQEVAFVCPRR